MNLRRFLKALAFTAAVAVASPLILGSWLEKFAHRSEAVFQTFAQLIAFVPGPAGSVLRAAFYWGTLTRCHWETHFGFGSIFMHRDAVVECHVTTGAYCVFGHAHLHAGTRVASRVSIPSGRRQHLNDDGTIGDVSRFDTVRVGSSCWIGENAVLLADVGSGSLVSAGAVVTRNMPENSLIAGNPAAVVRQIASKRS